MNTLVLNCGSSSLAFKVYEIDRGIHEIASGKAHRVGVRSAESPFVEFHLKGAGNENLANAGREVELVDHAAATKVAVVLIEEAGIPIDLIGNRFVHGGELIKETVIVTKEVLSRLESCIPLAPIHNPNSLMAMRAAFGLYPQVRQYVVSDNSFHRNMPEASYSYALPRSIVDRYGFRKFGFHGLSYKYVCDEVPALLGRDSSDLDIIACHLGTGGSSVAAIHGGNSIDTSMGYSPLSGLVMSTRCGDVDPMLTVYLMAVFGAKPNEIEDLLSKRSGLLGISSYSADIRDMLASVGSRAHDSTDAIGMYISRLRKYVGGYMTILGGADVLVFTDDIGAGIPAIRAATCAGLEQFGIALDAAKNEEAVGDRALEISAKGSRVKIVAIPNDEELVIAREALGLPLEVSGHANR